MTEVDRTLGAMVNPKGVYVLVAFLSQGPGRHLQTRGFRDLRLLMNNLLSLYQCSHMVHLHLHLHHLLKDFHWAQGVSQFHPGPQDIMVHGLHRPLLPYQVHKALLHFRLGLAVKYSRMTTDGHTKRRLLIKQHGHSQ